MTDQELHKELERISERWNPSDGMGIAHPILEEYLSMDIEFLIHIIKNNQLTNNKININGRGTVKVKRL